MLHQLLTLVANHRLMMTVSWLAQISSVVLQSTLLVSFKHREVYSITFLHTPRIMQSPSRLEWANINHLPVFILKL